MKPLRFTAGMLSPVAKLLAFLLTAVAGYALVLLAFFAISPQTASLPLRVAGGRFEIYYPFTQVPFLLGDYSAGYLIPVLLTTCFYGLFFYLLGGVFDAFRQKKLFVPKGVRRLSRFCVSNLVLPLLILLVSLACRMGEADMLVIAVLHAVLGVFAYFMTAIFREGLGLQEEQDLTL